MYNEQSSCVRMRRNLDQTKHIMNLVARTSIVQDRARALEHWQLSAMKGHAHSRHGLGVLDSNKGNYSVKHLMISAKIGYGRSLDMIKELLGWTCDKRPIRRGIEGVWRCHGRNEKPPSRRSEGTCWHSTRRLVLLQRKSLKIWRSYTFIQNDYRRFYHLFGNRYL